MSSEDDLALHLQHCPRCRKLTDAAEAEFIRIARQCPDYKRKDM